MKQWLSTGNPEIRDEWIAEKIRKLPSGFRVLDAGAGECRLKPSCSHLRYVSQDFGRYDGVGDDRGFQTGGWDNSQLDIVCDITSIPEADASFDAILCVEVIEHVPAPIEALREFARLLRSGGELILTAPFASLTHLAPYHYYSGFNQYFYRNWLEQLDLKVVELVPYGNFFDYLRQEVLRLRAVVRGYAPKARLGLLDYLALFRIVRTLRRLSKSDAGSHELLCFGYLLRAQKL